jgi:PBSX family phage terminase large subunit
VVAVAAPSLPANADVYTPQGAARELFACREPEVLIEGPAGTGKTLACLAKLHACLSKYPRMRALIARKTRESLTESALVEYEARVLVGRNAHIAAGPDRARRQRYTYPNGSVLVVGGLNKASRFMSAQYDLIYVPEATELDEDDWERLTTRNRNGVLPYQQLIGDCNPDRPTHWLNQRAVRGGVARLLSRHEDNPAVTPEYLATLDKLTGVRHQRLRRGVWAGAEGAVYDQYDPAIHLIDRFEIPERWRHYRVIDFGYTNPFVCQWWAEDEDGRLYRYREIYRTQRLVEDHAADIARLSGGERYEATIADHDAEDRATLRARGIATVPAYKAVSVGIQGVQARLAKAGDGRPRLFLLRDSLVGTDPRLVEAKKPLSTEQEFDGYIWATSPDGRPVKEEPVKVDDHGMDATRYLVAYVDKLGDVAPPASIWDYRRAVAR